jgi:GT2 family glycosyltransferase
MLNAVVVSVVIVSYNTREILRECLRSIQRETVVAHEVIVIDNVSADGTGAMIQKDFPSARFVQNMSNGGFARANNQGLAMACGEVVLFLNPDTVILDGAIDKMVAQLQAQPIIGLLGPHVFNADGATDQATAFWFPSVARLALCHIPLAKQVAQLIGAKTPVYGNYVPSVSGAVELVMGCCMLMRTAFARDIGGMNEEYFMYSEELDLCRAVHQSGQQVYYYREASIIHLGGASTSLVGDAMAVEVLRSMMRYLHRTEPQSLQKIRLLYLIGSTWRWVVWTILRWLGIRKEETHTKQSNHAAMLRWLVCDFHDFHGRAAASQPPHV